GGLSQDGVGRNGRVRADRLKLPLGSSAGMRLPRWGRRLATFALTLVVVLTVNFFLPRAMPGDPITALEDPTSVLYASDNSTREALLSYYGLDQPLHVQYLKYVQGLATGDLGWSIRQHRPVSYLIGLHLPWTLALTLPAILMASAISLMAGTHAGWTRGSRTDRALIVIIATVHTMPSFFLGSMALILFGVQLGWVPIAGAQTPFARYPNLWAAAIDVGHHWLLPVTVLTLEMLGGQFLLMRNSVITVLGEEFMLVARAKGLSPRRLKYNHAMRNAILPFATVFAMQLGMAATGAIVVEALFAYPGMGWLTFQSISARDYPVLQGVFLVISVAVLGANLLSDLLYPRIDPRVEGV
ncbi:MAG TPA: ABC transporter permease, partial [Chloroflexota bacterium]|nr:ABC transporter permease [Chloroflexota bacterium]